MQSYLLNLTPSVPFTAYQTSGDLFVYESGSAGSDAAERRIVVKPANGAEITLRPGQRFRLAPGERASAWNVRTLDPSVTLVGSVIIGAGEFDDANTLNKVQLDASFANNVYVNNTTAQRVPVTLDTTQTLQIAGNIVAYTNAYSSNTAGGASTAIQMLAAATNVNGVILNEFEALVTSSLGQFFTVIAKATAPANVTDGDILFTGMMSGTLTRVNMKQSEDGQIKVAAGKGIWYVPTATDGCVLRKALFTVL